MDNYPQPCSTKKDRLYCDTADTAESAENIAYNLTAVSYGRIQWCTLSMQLLYIHKPAALPFNCLMKAFHTYAWYVCICNAGEVNCYTSRNLLSKLIDITHL